VAPDLVFEVRSPGDRWAEILAKVAEYLAMGVIAVCVLDAGPRTIRVYSTDQPERIFMENEELLLPGILDGFHVMVRQIFE